jgi:hypothetical protein
VRKSEFVPKTGILAGFDAGREVRAEARAEMSEPGSPHLSYWEKSGSCKIARICENQDCSGRGPLGASAPAGEGSWPSLFLGGLQLSL